MTGFKELMLASAAAIAVLMLGTWLLSLALDDGCCAAARRSSKSSPATLTVDTLRSTRLYYTGWRPPAGYGFVLEEYGF